MVSIFHQLWGLGPETYTVNASLCERNRISQNKVRLQSYAFSSSVSIVQHAS